VSRITCHIAPRAHSRRAGARRRAGTAAAGTAAAGTAAGTAAMPEASPPPVEKPPPARSGWSLRGIFRRARSEPDAGPSPPPGAPRLLVDAPKRVMLARLPSRYIVDDAGALSPKISGKNTFGLVRFTVHEAALEAAAKGRDYFCVVSVGAQSWATREARARAPGAAAALAFDAGSEFVLQREGASLVRVALFRQGALDGARRSRLEGWAEVDLAQFLQDAPAAVGAAPAGPRDFFGAAEAEEAGGARGAGGANGAQGAADADAGAAHTGDPIEGAAAAAAAAAGLTFEGEFPLVDPSDPARRVGSVRLSARASGLAALERRVWGELLSLADFAGDGALSPPELGALLRAFGSNLPEEELAALFGAADANGDGRVDVEELAALLVRGSNFHLIYDLFLYFFHVDYFFHVSFLISSFLPIVCCFIIIGYARAHLPPPSLPSRPARAVGAPPRRRLRGRGLLPRARAPLPRRRRGALARPRRCGGQPALRLPRARGRARAAAGRG
jgi:hypothetical protein